MDDRDKGYYQKYEVVRLNDKQDKHGYCQYFVLDLTHDKYALRALATYALACEQDFPTLSEDLWKLVETYGT